MEYAVNLDDGEFFNASIFQEGKEVATVYDKSLVSLITAAPDLLEACKLILSGYDNPDNDGSFDWPEAAEILRKAIAKALGEEI